MYKPKLYTGPIDINMQLHDIEYPNTVNALKSLQTYSALY